MMNQCAVVVAQLAHVERVPIDRLWFDVVDGDRPAGAHNSRAQKDHCQFGVHFNLTFMQMALDCEYIFCVL